MKNSWRTSLPLSTANFHRSLLGEKVEWSHVKFEISEGIEEEDLFRDNSGCIVTKQKPERIRLHLFCSRTPKSWNSDTLCYFYVPLCKSGSVETQTDAIVCGYKKGIKVSKLELQDGSENSLSKYITYTS
jgi:hypothetical protein